MHRLTTLVLLVLAAAQIDSPTPEVPESFDIKAEEGSIRAADLDMGEFTASDLVSFELAAKGQAEFFEAITQVPQMVSVLYLVSSKETNDIDLIVRDPNKKVVRQMLKRKDASFKFRADLAGEYNFLFINRKVRSTQYMEKLTITFAMHVGTDEGKALHKEDINTVESNLMDMHRQLSQFQMEQHISDRRQEAHFRSEC